MATYRITDSSYSVGVLDPALRAFDIIMDSPYGTSYNAYLVTGGKTALIDTVHADFFEEYKYNIGCLCDFYDIDYIIINHAEPDHSGSLARLLELAPKAEVVCTAAAKRNLENILNRSFPCRVVEDGDSVELGTRSLRFIASPMLHWPDSMMTYMPEERVLFSCDVFGAHFCQPDMFDEKMLYRDEYEQQFRAYYHALFSPFAGFVRAALAKLGECDIGTICPSHGPVLVENPASALEKYSELSAPVEREGKTLAIFYTSAYGCTKRLAIEARAQARAMGAAAACIDLCGADKSAVCAIIKQSDALMIGTPTINADAPAPVWEALIGLNAYTVKGKPAAVFGSYGWSGEACEMIASRLEQLKFKLAGEPVKACFTATEEDLAAVRELTSAVVETIADR